MSNYFQTLKRLERDHVGETANALRPRVRPGATPEPAPATAPAASRKLVTKGKAALKTPSPRVIERPAVIGQPAVVNRRSAEGFSALYENLRAIGNGAPVGTLVIAGASAGEAVERVTAGLAAEIARNGIRVLVAELYRSAGYPMLRVRMATPVEKSEAAHHGTSGRRHTDCPTPCDLPTPTRLELYGGPVSDALRIWLDEAHANHQVVIVQAPPLGNAIDAAMVARACDGLLLAVEAHATPREALRESVERADTAGCRVLGMVMEGRPEWRPRLLKRIAAMRNLF